MDKWTQAYSFASAGFPIMDIQRSSFETIKVLAALQNPYTKRLLEGNGDSPQKQIEDLIEYVYEGGPKPHWFQTGDPETEHPSKWVLGVA
jgi:hypothetical protein